MESWLTFRGTAESVESGFRLSGEGGGTILLNRDDVRIVGDKAEIKAGAKAKAIDRPATKKDAAAKAAKLAANCPGGKTYCIGLVEFCCQNDEAIGACVGVWDCS